MRSGRSFHRLSSENSRFEVWHGHGGNREHQHFIENLRFLAEIDIKIRKIALLTQNGRTRGMIEVTRRHGLPIGE